MLSDATRATSLTFTAILTVSGALAVEAAAPAYAITALSACGEAGSSNPPYFFDDRCIFNADEERFDPSLLILDVFLGLAGIAAVAGLIGAAQANGLIPRL